MLMHYINKARRMPPGELLRKSAKFALRRLAGKGLKCRDKYRSTYIKNTGITLQPVFYKGLDECSVPSSSCDLADFYMRHYFDLLGSGWVHNGFGEVYAGCEGHRYDMQVVVSGADEDGAWLGNIVPEKCLEDAQKIWRQVSAGYQPIDWQVDFKSGYRWSAKAWYMDVEYGHKPGVDVKVPWELARMQHLVQYVFAYMMAENDNKEKYVQEFQNEILDFIAQNPPRYGVNWRCTMDVGIRVANWLMVYDLFCSLGVRFDAEFNRILADSVYAHGVHILNNPEYSPQLTSNHYLSDIGGLLFAAMHLESTPETDTWLAFAIQELSVEMGKQFHADGSNFEASTSYHCLSTEIMLHCALLCRHIPEKRRERLKKCQGRFIKGEPGLRPYDGRLFDVDNADVFHEDFWCRLCRALQFVRDISDDFGCIPQIGDADSGRFLKLAPVFCVMTGRELQEKYANLRHVLLGEDSVYYDEDLRSHGHLAAAAAYLVQGSEADGSMGIEKAIICQHGPVRQAWMEKTHEEKSKAKDAGNNRAGELALSDVLENILSELPEGYNKIEYEFVSENNLLADLNIKVYGGMGLYIYRSRFMKLIARCGEVGQNGNGGHAHNDQLSVSITIDGRDIVQDCGSYLYTAAPEMRNKFRSTAMHFTPHPAGCEQNLWEPEVRGLFSMLGDRTGAKVEYYGSDGIIMGHRGFGDVVYREVRLAEDRIVVADYGRGLVRYRPPEVWSNGYGKLIVV